MWSLPGGYHTWIKHQQQGLRIKKCLPSIQVWKLTVQTGEPIWGADDDRMCSHCYLNARFVLEHTKMLLLVLLLLLSLSLSLLLLLLLVVVVVVVFDIFFKRFWQPFLLEIVELESTGLLFLWVRRGFTKGRFYQVLGCQCLITQLALEITYRFLFRKYKLHQIISNEQWKKPGCLWYIGDYTTQLYRDCNKPL